MVPRNNRITIAINFTPISSFFLPPPSSFFHSLSFRSFSRKISYALKFSIWANPTRDPLNSSTKFPPIYAIRISVGKMRAGYKRGRGGRRKEVKKVAGQVSASLRCITIANELITALMQYGRKVFRPFKGLKLGQAEWRRKFASGGSTSRGFRLFRSP